MYSNSPTTCGGCQLSIDLYRDGTEAPWGFRLKGGVDVEGGTGLEITKVFVGSASDGLLYPGDRVTSINHQDTSRMTHLQAQNMMKGAGTYAKMDVVRPGMQAPGGAWSNVAPSGYYEAPDGDASKIQCQPFRTKPLISPGAKSHIDKIKKSRQAMAVATLPRTSHGGNKGFRNSAVFANQHHHHPNYYHNPQNQVAARTVVDAINNKPFRTTPLVSPAPRTINDVHHAADHGGSAPQNYRPNYQPMSMSPGSGSSRNNSLTGGALPTVRNVNIGGVQKQVVSNQFNSPMGIYSDAAIAEAAGANRNSSCYGDDHQQVYHPGYVQSSKPQLPTPRDATFSRPQPSATFKLILESEMDKARDQKGVVGTEFGRQHNLHPDRTYPAASNRSGFDPLLLDSSINQSTSFKRVMYSVAGDTDL